MAKLNPLDMSRKFAGELARRGIRFSKSNVPRGIDFFIQPNIYIVLESILGEKDYAISKLNKKCIIKRFLLRDVNRDLKKCVNEIQALITPLTLHDIKRIFDQHISLRPHRSKKAISESIMRFLETFVSDYDPEEKC